MKERITLHDKSFKPYMTYEQVIAAIDRLAEKINNDFRDCKEPPVIVCVLNGAMMFTSELMQRLDFDCELVSIKLSSYSGTDSTGAIRIDMNLTKDIAGRDVIVCEDIVDTGNTILYLSNLMKEQGANSVKICCMLLKPEMYSKDVKLDYVAKEIPNDFIVGFGLDYNELGRNYKDIYVIE